MSKKYHVLFEKPLVKCKKKHYDIAMLPLFEMALILKGWGNNFDWTNFFRGRQTLAKLFTNRGDKLWQKGTNFDTNI
jgi:hypothetical protein